MSNIIYAICGKKTHGKDTLAEFISSCGPGVVIDHFAYDLKATCAEIFEVNLDDLYNTKRKEEKFSTPIIIDNYIEKINSTLGIKVTHKGYVASNYRELMQYYGTEYVRSVDDNYWIDKTIKRITNGSGKTIIISDLRFNKEYFALKNIGAKIIRVERIDAPVSSDSHSSENELNNIDVDFHIGTVTGNFDYIKFCSRLIYNHSWESLKYYDFRTVLNNFEKLKGVNLRSLKTQIEYYGNVLTSNNSKK